MREVDRPQVARLVGQQRDVTAHLTAQDYQSGGSKGLASADSENPALLDFTLISLGFDYKF